MEVLVWYLEKYRGLILVAALASCGPIAPQLEEDDDGDAIAAPAGPFDFELAVTEIQPINDDEIVAGIRPQITIRFNTYLDDESLLDYAAVSWRSGAESVRTRARYFMSEKLLIATPTGDLISGLNYQVTYSPERLFSVTGAPLESNPPRPVVFIDDTVEDPNFSIDLEPTWNEVAAIFDAKCNSCHNDPQWQLAELTPSGLVGVQSSQTSKTLVKPFDPSDSYLMHKILEDYPYRKFDVQPPPWSDATPLTADEQLMIELWITAGASKE